jgi:hypothetical protein
MSHVEDVPGEHREYVDVLCFTDCPQYQASTTAIKQLIASPLKRAEVLQRLREIASRDKRPIVGFDAMKGKFHYNEK